MTKKHYELLAGSISRSRMANGLIGNAKERAAAIGGVRLVAIDIAATLAADNPRFNRKRFLTACGF